MRIVKVFIILFFSALSFTHVNAQDFFEEEKDSVMWFYDYKPKVSIVYLNTLHYSPFGTAIWLHHSRYKFSSYFEFKGRYHKQAAVSASNDDQTSTVQVSANKLDMIGGVGVGSTIYENYLWYFNIGIKYSNYFVDHDYLVDEKGFSEHKFEYESPFKVHYGAGVASVFFEHLHVQAGIDFETFFINGGVGFVF